jgi:hypothetical protein
LRRHGRRRVERAAILLVIGLAALARIALADRQTLSVDEVFSLAMATGHSLEHPAAVADVRQGDWVELPSAVPAEHYRRYLEHEDPPAGIGRVIRSVRLSDTSPPLYYVLLHVWTRAFGTGDAALRLLSTVWALSLFPLLIYLARRVGGQPAVLPACILFAVSPTALAYSTEGRMYALVWFLTAALMVLTLEVARHGRRGTLLLWIVTGAAGLLTHYFFLFVWFACVAWLAIDRARWRRPALWTAVLATGLIVVPWYATVPDSLGQWRVTSGWLDGTPEPRKAVMAPLKLAWGLMSGHGDWDRAGRGRWLVTAVLVVAAISFGKRVWQRWLSRRRGLLWLCLLGACLGLVAFDGARGTHAALIPRYALAGLPAALALTAMGLGRVRPVLRAGLLALIVIAALPADRALFTKPSRYAHTFRQIAADLRAAGPSGDVVALVHSIPSGVLGVSRYADQQTRIASWVGQLRQRQVPDSVHTLTAGYATVVFIRIHPVGEPAPQEEWLRANATVAGEVRHERAHLVMFRPSAGARFVGVGRSDLR